MSWPLPHKSTFSVYWSYSLINYISQMTSTFFSSGPQSHEVGERPECVMSILMRQKAWLKHREAEGLDCSLSCLSAVRSHKARQRGREERWKPKQGQRREEGEKSAKWTVKGEESRPECQARIHAEALGPLLIRPCLRPAGKGHDTAAINSLSLSHLLCFSFILSVSLVFLHHTHTHSLTHTHTHTHTHYTNCSSHSLLYGSNYMPVTWQQVFQWQ